ncbi:MAG: hypothetical protein NZL85_04885 [Fimbriimonadales bacterium]|nr:hypothetical protein [Fimbriimonadales bacterium]
MATWRMAVDGSPSSDAQRWRPANDSTALDQATGIILDAWGS